MKETDFLVRAKGDLRDQHHRITLLPGLRECSTMGANNFTVFKVKLKSDNIKC